jgi:hypothetical protein
MMVVARQMRLLWTMVQRECLVLLTSVWMRRVVVWMAWMVRLCLRTPTPTPTPTLTLTLSMV